MIKMYKTNPPVIVQLETISNSIKELELYSMDVDGDDPTNAILYSKMQDLISEIKDYMLE